MHVLEDDVGGGRLANSHLVLVAANGHTWEVGVHQEHGQAGVAFGAVGAGHQGKQVGVGGVGDEALGAVEDVLAAVGALDSGGLAGGGVATSVGLGECKRDKAVALLGPAGVTAGPVADHRLHCQLLLLFGTEEHHRLNAQIVGAAGEAEAGVAVHQLLADPAVGDLAQALPAVLHWQAGAHQAHLKGLIEGVPVEFPLAVVLGGGGADLLDHEVVDYGHQLFVLFAHHYAGGGDHFLDVRHVRLLLFRMLIWILGSGWLHSGQANRPIETMAAAMIDTTMGMATDITKMLR